MSLDTIRNDGGVAALALRSVATTALVFSFFEILPHYPVGVWEVHLILGSTLLLIFGAGPASIGLARIVPPGTPYVDLRYGQALALSTAYQGGIVGWVAFWSLYGHGFNVETLGEIATFGGAYMTVVIVEPLVDLAVLAIAKSAARFTRGPLLHNRLHQPAA